MSIHKVAIPLFLVVLAAASPARAEAPSTMRSISVSGTGVVHAAPDIASISVGVTSEAATAGEALKENTSAMTRVIADLKGQGIAAKDIQTVNFNVNPRYQHFNDGRPPVITGYRVVNAVTIVVRDLGKLGAILDKAVAQGSNQVNGIRFSIDDAEKLEDEARQRAMTDARRKAELYARAGNVSLGEVMTIAETTVSPPQPIARPMAMEARARAVPIEAGEQEISATINVTWRIKD